MENSKYLELIPVYEIIIRPKKNSLYVSQALPASPSTPRIKNFYCISRIHIEKSSIHRELSV